jgi:membrane protein HdeD
MSTANPTAPIPDRAPGSHRGPEDEAPADFAVRRTLWDVVLGAVFIIAGVIVLGDVVVASVLSVLFIGWTLLISGVIGVLVALVRIGRGGFWIGLLGGALSLVAGLVFVRNPGTTLLALSLAAGALLITGGLVRIVLAVQERDQRVPLAFSGVVGIVLGLMILNRWPDSALWLLGTVLGVQLVVDGLLLIVLGRLRRTAA